MPETFEAYQYLNYLFGRWRVAAAACLVAVTLALGASLLMTKNYTSTAQILIEPPRSRGALSLVSPAYLATIRTYEHVASSDSLFKRAVEELGVRELDSRPLSRLKKAILDVETPPGTKILNIEVTLPDPVLARELASYIAQETVRVSLGANLESDERLTARLEKLRDAARERVRSAERAALDAASSPGQHPGRAGSQASPGLATRPEAAELERKAAWAALEVVELQLGEARALAGERGERLQVIDPGVVPEIHSSPNLPLNLFAAFFLALVASMIYLTLEFSYQQRKAESIRRSLRVAGHG